MIQRIIITLLVAIGPFQCKAQYILWNGSAEREYQTIEEWSWMVKDGYKNHFYHYTLDCLDKLDYCNKNRKHTDYSETVNQIVVAYSDSLQSKLLATFSSFLSEEQHPIFFDEDAYGANVIFPGDIKINHANLRLMIDKNNAAIDFIQNITSLDEIQFDFTSEKTKEKNLHLEVPYHKGGWNYLRWGDEDTLRYSYLYHIPTQSHTITSIYLGTFTVEQLQHINKILQFVVDNY